MEQSTINIYINYIYALSWHIKHVGNKVWSGANGIDFEGSHVVWNQKNVYCS